MASSRKALPILALALIFCAPVVAPAQTAVLNAQIAQEGEDDAIAPSNTLRAIMDGMAQNAAGRKYYQALQYERGIGGRAPDAGKAVILLQESAGEGYAPAQALLGALYMSSQNNAAFKHDDTKAVALLQKALAQNPDDAATLYYLGVLYGSGRGGLKRDERKELDYYTRAATAGFAPAEHSLGYLYLTGTGAVAKNYAKARQWMGRSARQGMPESQYDLGYLYLKGMGTDASAPAAIEWFSKAARRGYAPAALALGNLYRTGQDGVAHDDAKALPWFQKAAEAGDARAQKQLGVMYGLGQGVSKNPVKSYFWLSLAEEDGDGGLLTRALIFFKRHSMKADDVTAADKAIANWKTHGVIQADMF